MQMIGVTKEGLFEKNINSLGITLPEDADTNAMSKGDNTTKFLLHISSSLLLFCYDNKLVCFDYYFMNNYYYCSL